MALKTLPNRLKALTPRIRCLPTDGGVNASFYQSTEFADWRKSVKGRDGWRCVKCGSRGPRLTADHIIEIEDGGARLDVANGQTLCPTCSNKKTGQARLARASRPYPSRG